MNQMQLLEQVYSQLAHSHGIEASVYFGSGNQVVVSDKDFFAIEVFGNKAVVRCSETIYSWARAKFNKGDGQDFIDGEALYEIEETLRTYGYHLGGEHLRFLYTKPFEAAAPRAYTYQFYDQESIGDLESYRQYTNALNFSSDVMAVGAFFKGELVALAGADNALDTMLQIGVDTLKQHRHKGLGQYLVNRLSNEIVNKGYIPYYTTWSPNLASMNLAIGIGYRPMWIDYFTEKKET